MLALGPFRSNLDIADTNQGFLAVLLNASLKPDGAGVAYGPLRDFLEVDIAHSFSLTTPPKGTLTAVTAAGVYVVFVMTTASIYRVGTDGAFTSIGSGYNLPAGDRWGATQFGKYAIFTNINDGMLQYDIELGGAITAVSGAPDARTVAVIFDSLFAFNCDGENRLMRYSSINDHTNWTTGTSNYQPMPDGEELQIGAEVTDGTAIIAQRNAIRVLYRTDTAIMFNMRKPISNKGFVNPWCAVNANGALYGIDTNGPVRVTPEGMEPIGRGKVDRWWLNDLATAGLSSVQGAYDAEREVIRWGYKQAGVVVGDSDFTAGIDFDIGTSEFVPIEFSAPLAAIFVAASPGYTMEELDAFGDMDDLNGDMSLDDRFYFGGINELGGLEWFTGSVYNFGYFNGGNLAATFETTTITLGKRTDILEVCPVTDSPDVLVSIGAKDRLSDALVFDDAVAPDEDGICPMYSAGRYIRFRAEIEAGSEWGYIRGYEDLNSVPGGRG